MKRFLALLLAALMTLSLCACGSKDEDKDPSDSDAVEIKPDDIALKSENFTMTMSEVSYIFFQNYKDFRYTNYESFNMYNIDPDKSLKEQEYHDGITWFEYFSDASVSYLEYILTFCEAAKEAGMELTDEDYETIDKTVASWTDYAKDMDLSEEELFKSYLGDNVNADTLRSFLPKETLALKYYNKMISEYSFTDDEMAAYANENRGKFYRIDYIKYTFDEDSDDAAAAHAEELAKITDAESFSAYIDNHINNVASSAGGTTDIGDCYVNYASRNEYSEFSKWAFDSEDAAQNTTYTEKNDVDGKYTVYLLTATPYLEQYKTRNIRYILENVSSHSSHQDTMDYLSGLLDKWKEGESTEDSFAEMAYNYSQDRSTNLSGGLEKNMSKSSTGLSKELINWLFDEGRQAGDTAVLRANQAAYAAVYYIGEDEIQWKYLVRQSMTEDKYLKDYEDLQKVYPVTTDSSVVNGIAG